MISGKKTIRAWFEDQHAYVTCDELPGVTFDGECMDEALRNLTAFLAIDVMDEYTGRNSQLDAK